MSTMSDPSPQEPLQLPPTADCVTRLTQVRDTLADALQSLEENSELAPAGLLTTVAENAEQTAEWAKEECNRTSIGDSGLLNVLSGLVKLPSTKLDATAKTQCLRGLANSCVDHDGNREKVYQAAGVVSILGILREQETPNVLVKTTLGALLNISLGHGPSRGHLLENGVTQAIKRWLSPETLEAEPDGEMLVYLAARLIFCVLEESGSIKTFLDADGMDTFIPLLVNLLSLPDPSDNLVTGTAMEILMLITALNESAQDIVGGSALFTLLLDFIEKDVSGGEESLTHEQQADPSDDKEAASSENEGSDSAVDIGKMAVAVVTQVSSSDANLDRFFQDQKLLSRLRVWLASGTARQRTCAALCLGNLARTDENCKSMAHENNLVPLLLECLKNSEVTEVQHAVTGLLKNLSLPAANKDLLGEQGTIELVAPLLEHRLRPIYYNVVGIVKHLTTTNGNNALRVTGGLDDVTDLDDAPIAILLRLLESTEDEATRSEGSRVLINLVKHGWSTNSTGDVSTKIRTRLDTVDIVTPITRLAATTKFPILRNESLIAMTLITASGTQLESVKSGLVREYETKGANMSGEVSSSASGTPAAVATMLDAVIATLRGEEGRIAPKVRANVCAFLECFIRISLPKSNGNTDNEPRDLTVEKVIEVSKTTAESLLQQNESLDNDLQKALRSLLELARERS